MGLAFPFLDPQQPASIKKNKCWGVEILLVLGIFPTERVRWVAEPAGAISLRFERQLELDRQIVDLLVQGRVGQRDN